MALVSSCEVRVPYLSSYPIPDQVHHILSSLPLEPGMYEPCTSIDFCMQDNVTTPFPKGGLNSFGFYLYVFLQGTSSMLSPIFLTLSTSLVGVSDAFEKKMATKILRLTKRLGCTLVNKDESEL